jgi:hypothetical protein
MMNGARFVLLEPGTTEADTDTAGRQLDDAATRLAV